MKTRYFALFMAIFVLGGSLSLAQEDFDDLLYDYVYEDEPGAVLYINYGGDEFQAALGLADLETEEELDEDSLFRIASATKPFVSTLVLQLVSEGEIDLDESISAYLPTELSENIANAEEATVRQVLQMTSGIYNYTETDAFYEAVEADPSYAWTAEEVLTYIYDEDAYFEAGTDYYYSNSNYVIAQIIIETTTGNSLADELESRIFEPLAMDDCYLETPELVAEDVVRGYQWDDADWYEDITEINDGLGLGDGGIVCSAPSLALFLPALMDGDLLDDEMLDEMLDSVDDGEGGTYGLGIVYEEGDFGTEVWHDGSSSGFQSIILYLPDEDLSLVILSNDNDAEIIADLAYDAIELVFEQ